MRDLANRLRLIVITDVESAAPRSVEAVVDAALRGGAPAVQLRDKGAPARAMLDQATRLRALTRRYDALFFVNDRLDVALAAGADGIHVGPDDLPVGAVRAAAPPGFLIGYSADQVDVARESIRDGADYIGCGAVYETVNKDDAGRAIGPDGLARMVASVAVPVVGIGGISEGRLPDLTGTGAAGVAVIGAVMGSADPQATTSRMMRILSG